MLSDDLEYVKDAMLRGRQTITECNAFNRIKELVEAQATSTNIERVTNCAAFKSDSCCRFSYVKWCGAVPCVVQIAQSAPVS
jgi:hypothetical protein